MAAAWKLKKVSEFHTVSLMPVVMGATGELSHVIGSRQLEHGLPPPAPFQFLTAPHFALQSMAVAAI